MAGPQGSEVFSVLARWRLALSVPTDNTLNGVDAPACIPMRTTRRAPSRSTYLPTSSFSDDSKLLLQLAHIWHTNAIHLAGRI